MRQVQPGGAFVVQDCESPFFQFVGALFVFGNDAALRAIRNLDIEVFDVEGVFFDELAAGFDVVAHEDSENLIRAGGVIHGDL